MKFYFLTLNYKLKYLCFNGEYLKSNYSQNWEDLHQTNRNKLLKKIFWEINIPLTHFFKRINCFPKYFITSSLKEKNDILINFKTERHFSNIGNININKFVSYDDMSTEKQNESKKILQILNNHLISDKQFSELTAGNPLTISLSNLKILRKQMDTDIPVENIISDDNLISGSYLSPEFAIKLSIKMLSMKSNKSIDDLNSEIVIRISCDGTRKLTENFIVYIINAFELNEFSYSSPTYSVLLAVLIGDEKYQVLNHYFSDFHRQLQTVIDNNEIFIDNKKFILHFVMCSDYKNALILMRFKSFSSKQNCI